MTAWTGDTRPLWWRNTSETSSTLSSRLTIRRWDGTQQPGTLWDGLRRDAELWSPTGDCKIFLYAKGQSQRGASFRVSYQALCNAGCTKALQDASAEASSGRSSPSSSTSTTPIATPLDSPSTTVDLYLPAPSPLDREDAFRYHVTTRNFFAWLQGKPMVGESLGWALKSLSERVKTWVPAGDIYVYQEMMQYTDLAGYLNFVDLPENALAMLQLAEEYQDKTLWIDAFAHCVGMKDRLPQCSGWNIISRKSKALMSRAHLEMDLHLDRATNSIMTFLEDELSSAHLGLVAGARNHLDNFRTFVQQYCVAKYGYWPPPQDGSYNKELFEILWQDFRALYEHLADTHSFGPRTYNTSNGGVCVVQNLEAFNSRHRLPPLPYSLPLIPQLDDITKFTPSSRGFLHMRSSSKDNKLGRIMTARHALENATNRGSAYVDENDFVMAYRQFEGNLAVRCEDKVSVVEARKVRWILVYGMLQMLTSITQSPPEVRDAMHTPYPLCCLTEGCPPWDHATPESITPPRQGLLHPPRLNMALMTPPTPQTTLQPDCEFTDYFNLKRGSDGILGNGARPPTPPPRKSPMRRLTTMRRASVKLSKKARPSVSTRSQTTPLASLGRQTPAPDSPVSTTGSSKCSKSPAPSLSWSAEGADSSCTEDEAGSPMLERYSFSQMKGLEYDIDAMIAKAQEHAPDIKAHPAFNTVDSFLDTFLVSGFT